MSTGKKPRRLINAEEKPDLMTGIIVRSQSGETEQEIANAMGLSRHQVRTLKEEPEYLELLRKQKEAAEKRIVSAIVPELETMTGDFLEGLRKNLKAGDAPTLRLYAEVVGLKSKDAANENQVGGLTVIMPGSGKEEKNADAIVISTGREE